MDHPDGILYFCDWVFLNYRINQIINAANVLGLEEEAFSTESLSSFKRHFDQTSTFYLNYFEKKYFNKFSLLVFPAIDNEEWTSFRPFVSSEFKGKLLLKLFHNTLLELPLREKVSKLGKLPSQIQSSYLKNINYGLRMWKSLLQQQIDDLTSFFNYKSYNFYSLKIICSLIIETTSAIYLKYKAVEPSRIRNPQYINDLKFFLDNSLRYMKIILGLTIMRIDYEDPHDRKIWNSLILFLVGTLNSLWWTIKCTKCHLALLEANHSNLASFLQDCINGEINLPIHSDEEYNQVLMVSEYLKNKDHPE